MTMSVFVYCGLSLFLLLSFHGSVISKWTPVQIMIFGCCFCLFRFSRRLVRDHRFDFLNTYRHLYSWSKALKSSNVESYKRYLPVYVSQVFPMFWVKCYESFLCTFQRFQTNSLSCVNACTTSFVSPGFPT